jgi:hypothetical protein
MNASTKLLTAAGLALALGACASQPTEVADQSDPPKRSCVRETGTRIEHDDKKKCDGPGRTYTREDLERSGGISTGEAVKRLGVR